MTNSAGVRGTTWKRLCAAVVKLPGVEEGTSYGTPALHVRKKLLARLREEGETVAVAVELLDREVLLEADPKAFFVTDHYLPYPMVLMRLAEVHHGVAVELLKQAWRRAAPKRLSAERGKWKVVRARGGRGHQTGSRGRTTSRGGSGRRPTRG